MMKNHDKSIEIYHNPNWSFLADLPYIVLVIGGSVPGKTDALMNLIKHQRPDTDKIYF